jgi:hypothetical protein
MLGVGVSLRSLRSSVSGAEDASVVTWDSNADTYTQSLYAEDASVVTWDSNADTYTQSTYGA